MQVDYIIVGAGSAGCVLAEKLSRCGRYSVVLIETGGAPNNPWISIPAGFGATYYHPKYNYCFTSQAEPHLDNRPIYVPRGKGLGGSGSINAMIYARGAAHDFDDWAKHGNPNWNYQKLTPYFASLEQHLDKPLPSAAAASPYTLGITPMASQAHPICHDFIRANKELNLPLQEDFNRLDLNNHQLEGAGIYAANIRHGKRDSSYQACLKPALKRANLHLLTHTQVNRLCLKDREIKAVEIVNRPYGLGQLGASLKSNKPRLIKANKEVILCAGAVGSPQLLQLSGIGDKTLLSRNGIATHLHCAAVGENLQDHLCASFYYSSHRTTLNDDLGSFKGQLKATWRYLMYKQGPLSLSVNQAGGFYKGAADLPHANLQLYFNPLSYVIPKQTRKPLRPLKYSGFLLAVNACRPTSQGYVRIQSPHPQQAPAIQFNYLASQHDQKEAIQAAQLVTKLMQAPSLKAITKQAEPPSAQVVTDAQRLAYFRQYASSIYHLCGTCRMGEDPQKNVVDEQLQVHYIKGLRIADASVFPNITSTNTNAASMMVAAKAADLILSNASTYP